MLKKISTFFVASIICAFPSISHALDWVIDVEAEANTLHTFEKLKEQAKTLSASKDYLNTAKDKLIRKIQLDEINLASLTPQQILAYIQNADKTVTPYNGAAPLTQESAFNQFYMQPVDPNIVEAELKGLLSQDQLNAVVAAAKEQKMRHDLFIEGIKQAHKERDLSSRRLNAIQQYGQQVADLAKSKSSLQAAQATATQLNFSLQQQEQLIKQSQEHLQYIRLQKAEEEGEKAKVQQAIRDKIQEAAHQGTSGYGSDRWGEL